MLPHMSEATTAVREAADMLMAAGTTGIPCPPVRDLIGSDDVTAAYAVQELLTSRRLDAGGVVTGRKIGLTSKAVQDQLGVSQPDFGVLFADMAYYGGDTVPADAVLQPRVEAEIAFVLEADLTEGPLDDAQVRAAIRHASPALEICGSRIAGWDVSFGDTVADNASAGAYVLGPLRKTLAEFRPEDVTMSMTINGNPVSSGSGDACLGDPVAAVVWLARAARDLGDPLRAGQVVLAGALGPMRAVSPGDVVRATVSGLGAVTFTLGSASDSEREENSCGAWRARRTSTRSTYGTS
jgi:2-keto-4-pentenoate hydratase